MVTSPAATPYYYLTDVQAPLGMKRHTITTTTETYISSFIRTQISHSILCLNSQNLLMDEVDM